MGLLKFAKVVKHKMAAAVVMKDYLNHEFIRGNLKTDPVNITQIMLDKTWKTMPDVFNGSFGQFPHKLAVVSLALTSHVNSAKKRNEDWLGVFCAARNVMDEVYTNKVFYNFSEVDELLIQKSIENLTEAAEKLSEGKLKRECETDNKSVGFNSWQEWIDIFKLRCSEINIQLELDENNGSFVDYMDQTPLRQAYNEGIDPVEIADDFAPSFNLQDFLRQSAKRGHR